MPFQRVINPKTGQFYNKEHLREIFEGLDSSKDTVASCGTGMSILFVLMSGVTASIIYLALDIAGFQSKSIYDGSWTEWATRHANNPNMIVKKE